MEISQEELNVLEQGKQAALDLLEWAGLDEQQIADSLRPLDLAITIGRALIRAEAGPLEPRIIRMPSPLWHALNAVAEVEGKTPDQIVQEIVRRHLGGRGKTE